MICVANQWLQAHDASASFSEVVAGRVGCLSLALARGPRCYFLGIHNFELGEKLKDVFDFQRGRAHWIREQGVAPGIGVIYGDFNFAASLAPRWRFGAGFALKAIGQTASDRSGRQKWAPLLNRTIDVTKHEATHTSITRDTFAPGRTPAEGTASVIDHVYLDIDAWQHEFTWSSTNPVYSPFQMKSWGISDHAPVEVTVSDNFQNKHNFRSTSQPD